MIVKNGKIIAISKINHDESLVGDGVSANLAIAESYKNVFSSYLNHSAAWDNKIDSAFLNDYSAFTNSAIRADENLSSNINNISSFIDNNSAIWAKDTTYIGSEYIKIENSAISLIKIPDEISDLSGVQTKLSADLSNLSSYTYTNIDALSSDVYNLSSNVNYLSSDLNKVSGKIPELSSYITNVLGDLNELSGDVSQNFKTIYGDITDISGFISINSGNIYKISGEINTISGNITDISSKVNTLSGNITDLSGNVHNLSSNVNTLSGNLNTLSGNLNTVSGNLNTLSSNFNTLSSNLNTVSGNVGDLSSNFNTLSGDLRNLSSYAQQNISSLSSNIFKLSSEKQDIISGGQYINVDKNIVSYTGPTYNNAFYSGSDLLGYVVNKGENGQILSMSGDNFEWINQSASLADVEIYGHNGINVNSSYSGNTLVFDLSGSTTSADIGYIELNTNLSAISANQDIVDNVTIIDNHLYTISGNSIVIPEGTSQICVNVNARFTPTAYNASNFYEFGINLLNGKSEILSNQSKFALTSGSDVLSYSKLVKLDSSIENSIYFKFNGDSNQFKLDSCIIDVYENQIGFNTGTSDTYEVKVESTGAAGFLKEKITTTAPIQNKVENDKYVIYQDPVGASPLSRISTPGLDNVLSVLNVATDAAKGAKIAVQLHSFTVGNYFVPKDTDIWTYINTNIQGTTELTVHFVGIYELDKENHTLHLVAMSVNGASHDTSVIGLASLAMGYMDSTYNTIKPSKIYYAFHACDQTALTIAGNNSSTYNLLDPYMSLRIYNIDNALTLADFVTNLATINVSTTTLSHQESTGKRYVGLHHI